MCFSAVRDKIKIETVYACSYEAFLSVFIYICIDVYNYISIYASVFRYALPLLLPLRVCNTRCLCTGYIFFRLKTSCGIYSRRSSLIECECIESLRECVCVVSVVRLESLFARELVGN